MVFVLVGVVGRTEPRRRDSLLSGHNVLRSVKCWEYAQDVVKAGNVRDVRPRAVATPRSSFVVSVR